MALYISQASVVLAILEQGAENDEQKAAYAKIRVNLLDGIQDVAEVLDEVKGDLSDTIECYTAEFASVEKALRVLTGTK